MRGGNFGISAISESIFKILVHIVSIINFQNSCAYSVHEYQIHDKWSRHHDKLGYDGADGEAGAAQVGGDDLRAHSQHEATGLGGGVTSMA